MSLEVEATISGQTYRVGKLNLKQQGRLTRKLAPFIKIIFPFISGKVVAGEITAEQAIEMLKPFMDMLSTMSDESWDTIVSTCMSVVYRKDTVGWQKAWNDAADMPQYQDIELPQVVMLVGVCVKHNLGAFMQGPPLNSPQ